MSEPAAPQADLTGTPLDHRVERGRRLRWSILTSLLVKPLAVVTPIVTVRLFVQYLGTERYGLYESIAALAIWIGMTHMGLTLGLMNKLAECSVTGDQALARRYVSSLFFAVVALVVAVCVLVAVLVPLIEWQWIFPTTDPRARREIPWAVLLSGWFTMLGLLVSVPVAIYSAYQEAYRANFWDGVVKVLTLLACVAVVYTRWGLVGVVVASAGMPVLLRVPNSFTLFLWEKPWLAPRLRDFDWSVLRGTMWHGLGLFILHLASVAVFQSDKLVISSFIGPEAVTSYAIVGRLFLIVFGLYMLLLSPLWPAYGDALRRGDRPWVRKMLWRSSLFGCAAMAGCGAVLFVRGDVVLQVWTGDPSIAVSRSLVVALTCLFTLWAWISGLSVVLNAAGVIRAQGRFFVTHAVLNVGLAIVLAKAYGVVGVAWSATITGLLTSAWGYPWLVWHYIFKRDRSEANSDNVAADAPAPFRSTKNIE